MFIKLTSVLLIFFICSCATKRHSVYADKISLSHDKVFKIGTIKVPCSLQCLPSKASYYKDQQLMTAKNMNPQEVVKILSETYGLKIDENMTLEEKSYPIHFTAMLSNNMGRCYYMENSADPGNENVVDISYDIAACCIPLRPLTATPSYKITVKSKGDILMEHQDELDTINFGLKWLDVSDIENIVNSAQKIPVALKRDVNQK